MFREAKTAQMATYLLKLSGGGMNYTKLMKLLYLADRESMSQTGDSMTRDRFFSLDHGPVLSQTLDMIREAPGPHWAQLISKQGYDVVLTDAARALGKEDLDELSPANCRILDQLVEKFGRMSWKQVVKWTHDNCVEWRNPQGSSHPISALEMFEAIGFDAEQAKSMAVAYEERSQLDCVMDRYS